MTDKLVRTQLESSLALGSLKELVRSQETVMLLIDTSGSMVSLLADRRRRRIDALREVVAGIKAQGTVPMIAFGGPYDAQVRFVDVVPEPDGGTPLHIAIPFAKDYGANRLVVISDGIPDLHEQSMAEARNFGGQIDVIFVGDANEPGSYFLDELAKATDGKRFEGDLDDTKKLTGVVVGLLMGEVEERKAPIQGPGFTTVDVELDEEEEEEEEEEDDEDFDDEDDEEEDENEDF